MVNRKPVAKVRYLDFNYGVQVVYEPGPLLFPSLIKRLRGNQIFLKALARLTRGGWPWLVKERWQVNERIVEMPFVLRSITEGERLILDLGCCESALPLELAHLGYKVVGVDQREYLISHPNFRFVQGDICQLSFPSNLFDVVVSLSTIEHVGLGFYRDRVNAQGDLAAVKEIWRVLKPGGKLLLTAPYGRPCESWQRVYDSEGIKKLLSNFRVENMRYYKRLGQAWVEASREEVDGLDSSDETNAVVLIEARRQGGCPEGPTR